MSSPLCPNCREGMRSVERDMGGTWSCLYCEGSLADQLRLSYAKTLFFDSRVCPSLKGEVPI